MLSKFFVLNIKTTPAKVNSEIIAGLFIEPNNGIRRHDTAKAIIHAKVSLVS